MSYTIGPQGPINKAGDTGIFLPGRPHAAVVLYNVGTATMYLTDDQQQTDPTDGAPLGPGSSIPWDADRALYVVCPTQTELNVSNNSGIGFDAGAVAAQLNSQGLAQDIANAIYITGAPPVDQFTRIVNPMTMGNGSNTAYVDVSSYLSIFVAMNTPSSIVNAYFEIRWYTSPGGTIIATDGFYAATGPRTSASFIVRAPYFIIVSTATSGSTSLQVYGSYKALTYNHWVGDGTGATGGSVEGQVTAGFQTWYGNIPVGSFWVWQPDAVAGHNNIAVRITNTTTASLLVRLPNNIASLSTYIAQTGPTTAGQTDIYDLLLPAVPIELYMANTDPSSTVNFRITVTPSQPWAN